jgi:2-C-methyl-D-erythritol 4-phosphate cytidylyltransferase
MTHLTIILLAGGKGSRMNSETPKQFMPLRGKTLITYSLEVLKSIPNVKEIIIVCSDQFRDFFSRYSSDIRIKFATPGLRRQDSVYNGLKISTEDTDYVLIHDGARPFIKRDEVLEVIEQAILHGAATLSTPLKFTVKEKNADNFINKTLNRESLCEIQTPQVIKKNLLKTGFENAHKHNIEVTDDVSVVEHLTCVKLVMGSYQNIKITTPEDLSLAENFLNHA